MRTCGKPGCQREAAPRRRHCRHCLDLMQARKARQRAGLRAAGACSECATPLTEEEVWAGASRCRSCRDASNSRWNRWQIQHPEYVHEWHGPLNRRR